MAGGWIKMRTNLWDDPRVSKICDVTGQSEAAIIGALYWLWSSADEHTEDGVMPGLSIAGIDRKTGVNGIGSALCAIGWISDHPEGVRIVRFNEHNGQSAKRRCSESRRKMSARDADAEQTYSGSFADDSRQSGAPREDVDVDVEKSKPIKSKSRAEAATATRLPADWDPSPDDLEFCKSERPDLDPVRVADCFRDYWHAAPGSKGRKSNWSSTWRNWVRNEKGQQARAGPSSYAQQRDADRKNVADILTGRKPTNERTTTAERDITGECFRIA